MVNPLIMVCQFPTASMCRAANNIIIIPPWKRGQDIWQPPSTYIYHGRGLAKIKWYRLVNKNTVARALSVTIWGRKIVLSHHHFSHIPAIYFEVEFALIKCWDWMTHIDCICDINQDVMRGFALWLMSCYWPVLKCTNTLIWYTYQYNYMWIGGAWKEIFGAKD